MNRFGKHKDLSEVPPVPPKRPEKWEQESGAEEEDEKEDQYTYEVPPSEGQSKKVAPAKRQDHAENVYLDRPSLRRPSEPTNMLQPPKPLKFLSKHGTDDGHSEEVFKFTALEEGKKKKFQWCKGWVGDQKRVISTPALKKGMMKPPQPPPPPPLSARRVSLPPVLGLSGPQVKVATNRNPFLPAKNEKGLEEESVYIECEPITDGYLKCGSLPEDSSLLNKAWYAGKCDRHTAEAALLRFNKDSAYMVRQSSGHGWNQPFTLAVLYKNHVYNIPIRYLESSRQYTLGKDGKNHEELFDSVSSIIQNYTERSLVLIDGSTSAKEQTCLLFPVKP